MDKSNEDLNDLLIELISFLKNGNGKFKYDSANLKASPVCTTNEILRNVISYFLF